MKYLLILPMKNIFSDGHNMILVYLLKKILSLQLLYSIIRLLKYRSEGCDLISNSQIKVLEPSQKILSHFCLIFTKIEYNITSLFNYIKFLFIYWKLAWGNFERLIMILGMYILYFSSEIFTLLIKMFISYFN